jgi:hypothetical protein
MSATDAGCVKNQRAVLGRIFGARYAAPTGIVIEMDGGHPAGPPEHCAREFDELSRLGLHSVTPSCLISCISGVRLV